jgi:mannose-6-phosphate isomerase-like protein (cupin superfamily)
MTTAPPCPIAIADAIASLSFLSDRTPRTTVEQAHAAFRRLVAYREGAIFVGRWAGSSEWERHPAGDEIVMVLEGRTTIFFLTDEGEVAASLGANELVVVPQATWHRFKTPNSVTVLSVTPQPTDHSSDLPT